jgi:hypothetical protein
MEKAAKAEADILAVMEAIGVKPQKTLMGKCPGIKGKFKVKDLFPPDSSDSDNSSDDDDDVDDDHMNTKSNRYGMVNKKKNNDTTTNSNNFFNQQEADVSKNMDSGFGGHASPQDCDNVMNHDGDDGLFYASQQSHRTMMTNARNNMKSPPAFNVCTSQGTATDQGFAQQGSGNIFN